MLGLWTFAPLHVLVVEPELPAWLPHLILRNIRVADAWISIEFNRDSGGATDYRVLQRGGDIRVIRQPPPQDRRVTAATRLRELVESLLPGH